MKTIKTIIKEMFIASYYYFILYYVHYINEHKREH